MGNFWKRDMREPGKNPSLMSGLTLSSSLSEILPSEAVLLQGSSPTLRRLFLKKKVESKLLSSELSGWADVMSVPRARPRYNPRLPSAPGGPLVVFLDRRSPRQKECGGIMLALSRRASGGSGEGEQKPC